MLKQSQVKRLLKEYESILETYSGINHTDVLWYIKGKVAMLKIILEEKNIEKP